MTEFVGMDLEMAFEEHYHEVIKLKFIYLLKVLDLLEQLFISIFTRIETECSNELDMIKKQCPFENFKIFPKNTDPKNKKCLRLKYSDGIDLLKKNGIELNDYDDLRYFIYIYLKIVQKMKNYWAK